MSSAPTCIDPSSRPRAALAAYLYDECEPDERERVEAHVDACAACADELDALRSARGTLGAWTPPDPVAGFKVVPAPPPARAWSWTPAWAVAALVAVVLLVGVTVARVEIRYDAAGFVFRLGGLPAVLDARSGTEAVPTATAWQADLTALETRLRQDLGPEPAAGPRDQRALVDQVRGLIAESERRQQQELALRFTEFAQEFDMQRRADQQRFEMELGALEGYTNYLVRTAGR